MQYLVLVKYQMVVPTMMIQRRKTMKYLQETAAHGSPDHLKYTQLSNSVKRSIQVVVFVIVDVVAFAVSVVVNNGEQPSVFSYKRKFMAKVPTGFA